MTWKCIPVNCAPRLAKIKHLAPKVLATLLAAAPPPTTACTTRCHWVWSGPLPAGEAVPPLVGGPGVLMAPPGGPRVPGVSFFPPGTGWAPPPEVVSRPPPTAVEIPPTDVPEPASGLLLALALLGLGATLNLWRVTRRLPPPGLRPERKV